MATISTKTIAERARLSEQDVKATLEICWTVQLLAAASNVTGQYIRKLLQTGKLPGISLKAYWLIRREDGDKFLTARGISIE